MKKLILTAWLLLAVFLGPVSVFGQVSVVPISATGGNVDTATLASNVVSGITITNLNAIGVPVGSVQIGTNASVPSGNTGSIAIGTNAVTSGALAVAIGRNSKADANSVAIGNAARSTNAASTCIGTSSQAIGASSSAYGFGSQATNSQSSAYGYNSVAWGANSTAIGQSTTVTHDTSTAIGSGATTSAANQIMLGTASENVRVPGSLTNVGVTTTGGLIITTATYDSTPNLSGTNMNTYAGRVTLAATTQSYIVTNNLVTANSIVVAVVNTDDSTALNVKAIPSSGKLTLKANAAANATTTISFWIAQP